MTTLRNKKLLNCYLESYLTKSSFGLLNDPNFALVNFIRNYLYFYSNDFYSDLMAANKPDENHLKISINEIFNSWSMLIISALEKKSYILKLASVEKYLVKNDSSEDTTDHENVQQKADLNDYMYSSAKKHSNSVDFTLSNDGSLAAQNTSINTLNQLPKATVVTLDERRLANNSTEREALLNQSQSYPKSSVDSGRLFFNAEPPVREGKSWFNHDLINPFLIDQ